MTPEDEEVDTWRGADQTTQPMMADIPRTGQYSYAISGSPNITQHPAYRGMEIGSSNPFVPVLPAPRRSAPNAKPGLTTDSLRGQDAYTTKATNGIGGASPKPHPHGALEAGAAGLTAAAGAGAATNRISRKPVANSSPSRLRTSDQWLRNRRTSTPHLR